MHYFDMFNRENKANYLFPLFTLLTLWYCRLFSYIMPELRGSVIFLFNWLLDFKPALVYAFKEANWLIKCKKF